VTRFIDLFAVPTAAQNALHANIQSEHHEPLGVPTAAQNALHENIESIDGGAQPFRLQRKIRCTRTELFQDDDLVVKERDGTVGLWGRRLGFFSIVSAFWPAQASIGICTGTNVSRFQ
jgi:hypothetical protein